MSRVRVSLQQLEADYIAGNRKPLENLIRAFIGIQAKEPTDPNSFFIIGGYHGEPFKEELPPDIDPSNWWGGYCHHGNVLFPTWHRAYLLRLENALRSIEGCQDVTIPFWDECLNAQTGMPIPDVLTRPTFVLDEREVSNPLYSYKLPVGMEDPRIGTRYSKHKDYETVRFPLSGLVGTPDDRQYTEKWNSTYTDLGQRTSILNGNVANWLNGTIDIEKPDKDTRIPDITSVISRFKSCLQAPNYTLFSNNTSANNHVGIFANVDPSEQPPTIVISLESPHNAIHLAVGGFWQDGVYAANPKPIVGANGDMGDNETAGLDPIFFFHHCFIDYAFWKWQQKHNQTAQGSINIDPNDPGAKTDDYQPGFPRGTPLDMNTPLRPFQKPGHTGDADTDYYTSADIVDIEKQLDYTYGRGSLDPELPKTLGPELGGPLPASADSSPFVAIKEISGVNRAQYRGSFVIRTYATTPSGREVEVGREPVLSRWYVEGCANCRDKLEVKAYVPIHRELARALREDGEDKDVGYQVRVQTSRQLALTAPPGGGEAPSIGDLY